MLLYYINLHPFISRLISIAYGAVTSIYIQQRNSLPPSTASDSINEIKEDRDAFVIKCDNEKLWVVTGSHVILYKFSNWNQ